MLAFLMAWLTPWRSAYRIRAAHSGLKFFVHRRDTIGRHIAKYGSHEPLLTKWLADYLGAAPPGIVVDVGANVGWHALHAAQYRNVEAVVAFEPDPFNAWLLDRNLSANGIGKVIVNACAVGAQAGSARLFRYKSSNLGRHSIVADHGYGYRTVPVTDLDSALSDLGFGDRPVVVIKIDVEGYEPAVIAGARRTLARTEAVVVEFSPGLSRAGGLSTDDLLTRLHHAGFTPFALRSDGGTIRLNLNDLRGFLGTLDVIWTRTDRWTPAVARAMKERDRGALTLNAVAEQNSQIVKAP
jgi:FkbM family methyltransferase